MMESDSNQRRMIRHKHKKIHSRKVPRIGWKEDRNERHLEDKDISKGPIKIREILSSKSSYASTQVQQLPAAAAFIPRLRPDGLRLFPKKPERYQAVIPRPRTKGSRQSESFPFESLESSMEESRPCADDIDREDYSNGQVEKNGVAEARLNLEEKEIPCKDDMETDIDETEEKQELEDSSLLGDDKAYCEDDTDMSSREDEGAKDEEEEEEDNLLSGEDKTLHEDDTDLSSQEDSDGEVEEAEEEAEDNLPLKEDKGVRVDRASSELEEFSSEESAQNAEEHEEVAENMAEIISVESFEPSGESHCSAEESAEEDAQTSSGPVRGSHRLRPSPRKRELYQVKPRKKTSKDRRKSTIREIETILILTDESEAECRMSDVADASINSEKDTRMSLTSFEHIEEDCLVWGRLGRMRFWPAITITASKIGKKEPRPGFTWVFWFGDLQVSMVKEGKLVPFVSRFRDLYDEDVTKKKYMAGIKECLQWCAERAEKASGVSQVEDMEDLESLLDWANSGFGGVPPEDMEKPEGTFEALECEERCNEDEEESKESNRQILKAREACMDNVHHNRKNINDVCIVCGTDERVNCQHPLVEGGLCKECKDNFMQCCFCYGSDGTYVYCNICSGGGEMFVCSNDSCNRVFCFGCIEVFLNADAVQVILDLEDWECFMCQDWKKDTHGLVRGRPDWQERVVKLFTPKGFQLPNTVDEMDKRPIRVLSLFDGIGTGRYVLEKLGLAVDCYFSCEIDPDALIVSRVRQPDIVQLGNIKELTWERVETLSPIDLLIGGSPCNELSMANPARRGLEGGTGLLFFEFHRILNDVQQANRGCHLFWLFENVKPMPHNVKDTISRYLKCQPAVWDAKDFSAQVRSRYFWGNIPGMFCPLVERESAAKLADVLMPTRSQCVPLVRTVTTRPNSLMQGRDIDVYPVIGPDGQGDRMWTPELEKLFGFPPHYTDVGDLAAGRRRLLIGRSWSVPVVCHILSPLKDFYICKDSDDTDMSA